MLNPDDDHGAHVTCDWMRRVRFGLIVLFWTFLLSYLLPNLIGFALPFIGGHHRHLAWNGLIHLAASIPLVIGVLALTAPCPAGSAIAVSEPLRRVLRILVWLDVLRRVLQTGARLHGLWRAGLNVSLPVVPMFFAHAAPLLSGLMYIRHLSLRLSLTGLARSFTVFTSAYFGLLGLELACLALELHVMQPKRWSIVTIVSWLLIWVWGLVLLRKLAGRLKRAINDQCMHCGYLLRGLPEPRCPECGRPFLVPGTPSSPVAPACHPDPTKSR